MIKITTIIGYVVFVCSATLCKPTLFADNIFLGAFITHELLAILAVIVTVTFASVANVHLTINRIIARAYSNDISAGQLSARATRLELNQNAWTLFGSLVFSILILFIKGSFPKDINVLSITNGLGLGVLLLSVLILYDIYRVVFVLVNSEFALSENRAVPGGPDAP